MIGPLARSAGDLALALKLTVGPDEPSSRGLVYRLPAPPKSLKGLRVAVWLDQSIAPVDDSVQERVEAAARALAKAGAKVDFKARPAFDAEHALRVYGALLHANLAARRVDYAQLLEARARLRDDDRSEHALNLRASTASFKEVFDANHQREALRWAWHDFFGKQDLLLMPITATAAYQARPQRADAGAHDAHQRRRHGRTSGSCSGPVSRPHRSCRPRSRRVG